MAVWNNHHRLLRGNLPVKLLLQFILLRSYLFVKSAATCGILLDYPFYLHNSDAVFSAAASLSNPASIHLEKTWYRYRR